MKKERQFNVHEKFTSIKLVEKIKKKNSQKKYKETEGLYEGKRRQMLFDAGFEVVKNFILIKNCTWHALES